MFGAQAMGAAGVVSSLYRIRGSVRDLVASLCHEAIDVPSGPDPRSDGCSSASGPRRHSTVARTTLGKVIVPLRCEAPTTFPALLANTRVYANVNRRRSLLDPALRQQEKGIR